MKLAGQARRQDGYAMAALLVAMSVMAVMMSVAMPVWKQIAQREKEEELVFRGEQYARAIGLFQRKFANVAPPSIDVLVEQRFLRKKYKDPITGDDFVPLTLAQTTPGTMRDGGPPARQSPAPGTLIPGPGSQMGGITGVASKSTATSIRLYKGRNHYNEWQFLYTPPVATAGSGAPGQPTQGAGGGQGRRGQGGMNPTGGGGMRGGGTTPTTPRSPTRPTR